jgi:hypothetical protein
MVGPGGFGPLEASPKLPIAFAVEAENGELRVAKRVETSYVVETPLDSL